MSSYPCAKPCGRFGAPPSVAHRPFLAAITFRQTVILPPSVLPESEPSLKKLRIMDGAGRFDHAQKSDRDFLRKNRSSVRLVFLW